MQIDFHYYCVAVLACAAGFDPADALTIAYASQYTDNAIESSTIKIGKEGPNLILFDPVRTAPVVSPEDVFEAESLEQRLARLKALFDTISWSTQKRVQMAFHFVPTEALSDNPTGFDYRVSPNSPLARAVLANAARKRHAKRRLCAIGIALHAYADTWAHQGFSGRRNIENDVNRISVRDPGSGKWKELGKKLDFFSILKYAKDAVADHWLEIGHVEALGLPDLCYLEWEYDDGNSDVARHNLDDHTDAALHIYRWLRRLKKQKSKPFIAWRDIEDTIRAIMMKPGTAHTKPLDLGLQETELAQRVEAWQEAFGNDPQFFSGHNYQYDETEWRAEAIPVEKEELEWERKSRDELDQLHYETVSENFWDTYWVHFHRAALNQRFFVLRHLP